MPARANRNIVISTVRPGAYSNSPPQEQISAAAGLAGDGDDHGEGAEVHRRVDQEVGDDGLRRRRRGSSPTTASGREHEAGLGDAE